ncbi:hypothetical protein DL93DRAFT_2075309 [Clavulina sp. PMI_390]|nr:hypothetical protein DL93DRAFT_2075309 [Clavulina sp. PMI_390]
MADKPPQYAVVNSPPKPITHLFYRLYNEDPLQPRLVSCHGVDPDDPTVGSIHIDRIPPPFTIAVLRDAICAAEGISGNAAKKASIYLPGRASPAKPKEVVEIIGTTSAPIGSDSQHPFLVVFHEPVPVAGPSGTSAQAANRPSSAPTTTPAPTRPPQPVTAQPTPTPPPRVDGWFTKSVEFDSIKQRGQSPPDIGPCGHIAVAGYLCLYGTFWIPCLCFICGGHCEQALKTACGCPIPSWTTYC